jgi:hypothetical protein
LEVLQEAILVEGLSAEIVPVTHSSGDLSYLPGSPTILFALEDLFPHSSGREAYAFSCRIYTTLEGLKYILSPQWCVRRWSND